MKNLIMDSSFLVYKSHFAFSKNQLSIRKGDVEILTSAIFGFINEILTLYTKYNYKQFICVWDSPPYLKKKIYPDYKKGRKSNIPDLEIERTLIKAILHDLGIPCVMSPGYEGEEVASSIMNKLNGHYMDFYTNDEDCYALLSDKVRLISTGFNKTTRISELKVFTQKELLKKYNATPKQFIQMKILMGCKTDNVPGANDIGPVKSSQLINQFGSVKAIVENISAIEKDKPKIAIKIREAINNDTFKISRKLTKIEKPDNLFLLKPKEPNTFEEILDYLEANTLTHGNKWLTLVSLKKKHAENINPIVSNLKLKTKFFE